MLMGEIRSGPPDIMIQKSLPYIIRQASSYCERRALLVATALQAINLVVSEETPSATLEILLCDTSVIYAVELLYGVTQVLEDTTHDTVTARVDLDAYLLLVLAYVSNLVGIDVAILQCETLGDLLHIGACEGLVESYLVNLILLQ